MEKNIQRNSRKRLNSLILLVAFTAVMLIISTYAWFSSQKNVSIGNLEGKVNVAEGLMVSLDAKNWSNSIDLTNPVLEVKDADTDGENDYTLAVPYDGGANFLPTEMLPVSTTGTEGISVYGTVDADGNTKEQAETANGVGSFKPAVTTEATATAIPFYRGINKNGIELSEIVAMDEESTSATDEDYPGYYAIDLFLQNSSKLAEDLNDDDDTTTNDYERQGIAKETLQLNTDSLLQLLSSGAVENTGLQNTVRVALALYNYEEDTSTTDLNAKTASVDNTATQAQILAAYENQTIDDVAIWEPNSSDHVDYIVTNNNTITWNSTVQNLYGISTSTNKFTATQKIPTYALLAAAKTPDGDLGNNTVILKNIYLWNDNASDNAAGTGQDLTDTMLKRQIALQTEKSVYDADGNTKAEVEAAGDTWDPTGGSYDYSIYAGGVRNLVSVKSTGEAIYDLGTEDGAVTFDIYKNQVAKVRLYVWLEGQDVDCINYASHGGGVHLDLGLVKGATPGSIAE